MITLKDLPSDILAVITSADNLDQSTRYTSARACKLLAGIIGSTRVSICDVAADGHLAILKWYATETQCTPSAKTVARAAANGHLHIIEYLRQVGCPWDEDMVSAAAAAGHLNVFAYAVENGCNYTPYSFIVAAVNGRVNILQYAYDNNINTNCSKKILDWFHNVHECSCRHFRDASNIRYVCRKAADAGNIDTIAWMLRLGYVGIGLTIRDGIINNHRLNVLEWLICKGLPLTSSLYAELIVASAPLEFFELLYAHDCPRFDDIHRYAAMLKPEVQKWLVDNY